MKIESEAVLKQFRGNGACSWCGKWRKLVPHHLFGRGHGGGSRLDCPEFLIALCDDCHWSHHQGHEPMRLDLLAKVAYRGGVLQDEIRAKHRLLLRTPKETFRGYRGKKLQEVVAKPLSELTAWIEERTVIA